MKQIPTRHPRIELVYDPTCPNVDRARVAIRETLTLIGAPPAWREWNCVDEETPKALRTLGSPTVLVNGQDVGCGNGPIARADANSCRIYRDECGCIGGAPSVQLILEAITRESSSLRSSEETA